MAPLSGPEADDSAIAALMPTSATARSTGLRSARTAGLRPPRANWARPLAGTTTGAIATRTVAIWIEAAGICVVGWEVRSIPRVTVGARRTCWTTFGLTRAITAFATRAAVTGIATGAPVPKGTWAARAWSTGTWATRATRTCRFVAVGLARTARAIRVAMAGRAGLHAIRHVPSAHRSGIVATILATLLARTQALTFRAWTLGLERFLRLLCGGFAADGQAAMLARRRATAPAILADIVESTQLATFIGGTVAADIARSGGTAYVHRGLRGLALAEHRHQGQC